MTPGTGLGASLRRTSVTASPRAAAFQALLKLNAREALPVAQAALERRQAGRALTALVPEGLEGYLHSSFRSYFRFFCQSSRRSRTEASSPSAEGS